ncbi:unnamed protein product [Microthlaspi erraticum]|uniref:Uncharacterized protein n=1 Tax=Microthlaspi erraticum TaxID=1685480 RepID=A0A6D2KLU1_9BRAS|nr:unnamed protein product [Microthlaspi erraticum]
MLSSNCEMGTNSSFLFPVQPVRFLWDFTQSRPHDRIEHPGHLYFHGFNLHSSQTGLSIFLSIFDLVRRGPRQEVMELGVTRVYEFICLVVKFGHVVKTGQRGEDTILNVRHQSNVP